MAGKTRQRKTTPDPRRKRGFERAANLLEARVRSVGETRGFAVSRLLTHWAEIVGEDIAALARPVDVSYGRNFGATLTVLTTGANAPMVEYRKEAIRERANACYGYTAISRVRITQTSPGGFAETQAAFGGPDAAPMRAPVEVSPRAVSAATGVDDDELRGALERLGSRILSGRQGTTKG